MNEPWSACPLLEEREKGRNPQRTVHSRMVAEAKGD
jgi:hypothetical protein